MKKNILFVCTGNSCRSVMAEWLFKRRIAAREKEFTVGSAGVAAFDGYPSTLETIRAMRDEGIDMSSHQSRRLTRELVEQADKIYVMEKLHREMIVSFWPQSSGKVHLLTEFSPVQEEKERSLDVPDPIRTTDGFYREVLKMIDGCVQNIAQTL